MGTALNMYQHRCVTIGIGRVAVKEPFGDGYQHEIDKEEEPEPEFESPIELQKSRKTATGVFVYGGSHTR